MICIYFISLPLNFLLKINDQLLMFSGEGFHNYHHTFPYDYATSEFGCRLNLTTGFINIMCVLGLAKDRRQVPTELAMARAKRTGDGSHRSG